MSIRPSPLLGYNNNVRHRGRIFHIQTEDSGARYGHIMTHLFTDGGRILKSVKTSYAEYVGNERMHEIVREMMKQQHKAMFIALRDGKFDAFAEGLTDSPPSLPAPPGSVSPRPGSTESKSLPPSTSVRPRSVAPPPPLPPPGPVDRGAASSGASSRDGAVRPSPTDARDTTEELALDIDALERAAAVDTALPSQRSSSDLPPPPAERLREKTGPGSASAAAAPTATSKGGSSTSPVAPAASDRRYAPTRPASIFGQARPQHGKSIFGEDLMSDKSLDEVILSYLADDLDEDDDK